MDSDSRTPITVPAHPGVFLETLLVGRNISQSELSRLSGLGFQRINGIVCGRRSVTPDSALRIEKVLDVDAMEFLNRQAEYDLWLRRKEIRASLKKIKPWSGNG